MGRTRTTGHVQKIEVQIQSHELRWRYWNSLGGTDVPYILCLLHVDERAEWVVNNLEKAYEAMEEVCQEIHYNTNFSELIIRNIISYISYKDQCVYNDKDDKVYDLKKTDS